MNYIHSSILNLLFKAITKNLSNMNKHFSKWMIYNIINVEQKREGNRVNLKEVIGVPIL